MKDSLGRKSLNLCEATESVGGRLEVIRTFPFDDPDLRRLDDGKRAAILLAIRMEADLLLIDDRDGVNVARSRGFAVTGTLGILDLAAGRGLIRLRDAVGRLKNTSFRCHPDVLDALLARHSPK